MNNNEYPDTVLKSMETHTVTLSEAYLINYEHETEKQHEIRTDTENHETAQARRCSWSRVC